jgi:hypothetical protein
VANEDSRKSPPHPDGRDTSRTLIKAGAAAVPIVGGPVAELVELIRSPIERRRDEWLRDLAARVANLEERGRLDPTSLPENDTFLDAVARGVHAAMQTGSTEKREALRNAVLNVALGTMPDEAERELFLEMIERFTPWHLRILKAFQDPVAWAERQGVHYEPALTSSLAGFLEAAFPELRSRSGLYGRVWSDLRQAQLTNTDSLGGNMTVDGWRARRTTGLGDRFLAFVTQPD